MVESGSLGLEGSVALSPSDLRTMILSQVSRNPIGSIWLHCSSFLWFTFRIL